MSNIRFFGPGIKPHEINVERNYTNDKSSDTVIQLAIELFPSTEGYLCHVQNKPEIFGKKFQISIEKVIQFMSTMFINVLKDTKISENDISEEFKSVFNLLNNTEQTVFTSEDAKMIKLMMIHSFMIHALDNKEDLKAYLNAILRVESISNNLKTLVLTSQEVNDQNLSYTNVVDHVLTYEQINKAFPYSKKNQPPSNSTISIPIYDRETDSFSTNEHFSDHVEITLLNLCNCLLYDPKNFWYSLERLPENSDIYNFYKKNSKLFTITDEIRKEWSRVVQGLSDFENIDDSEFQLHKIVYLSEKRNELDTGMINMMNVLIKIFNLDHSEIWKNFEGIEDIETKFQLVVSEISKNNNKTYKINNKIFRNDNTISIEWDKNSVQEIILSNRKDLFKSFNILIVHGEFEVKMRVNQDRTYIDIEVIEYHNIIVNNSKPTLNTKDNELMRILFMKFIGGYNVLRIDEIFKKLYFSDPILSDDHQKIVVLTYILDLIAQAETNSVNNDIIETLEGVTKSILESVNLTDRDNREYFQDCLVYLEKMEEEEIVECWNYSLNIQNQIYKLWQKRILSPNVENVSLFFNSSINQNRISEVFELLEKKENLKSLSLKNISSELVTKDYLNKIPKNLTSFELRTGNNYLDYNKMEVLTNYIKDLNSLQSLDIELKCSLNDYQKLISDLPSLENLKNLKIGKASDYISPNYTLSLPISPNLHSLEINGSDNELLEFKMDEQITYNLEELCITHLNFDNDNLRSENLACAFKKLSNLKVLKISKINIPLGKINYFSKIFESLTNLEELDISKLESLHIDNLINLSEEIKKLPNLKKLKISNKYLKLKEVVEILKELSELKSLRSLEFSCSRCSFCSYFDKTFSAEDFIKALGNLTSLTELETPYFTTDEVKLKIMVKAIEKLVKLEKLDISLYAPTRVNTERIFEILKKLTNLKHLNITNWKFDEKDLEKLKLELPNLETIIY